jgi:hypothetical protein
VHPQYQADAIRGTIRFSTERQNLISRGEHGLPYDSNGKGWFFIQGLGDLDGIFRNLRQGFGAIEVLATCDKPDFVLFGMTHAVSLYPAAKRLVLSDFLLIFFL